MLNFVGLGLGLGDDADDGVAASALATVPTLAWLVLLVGSTEPSATFTTTASVDVDSAILL